MTVSAGNTLTPSKIRIWRKTRVGIIRACSPSLAAIPPHVWTWRGIAPAYNDASTGIWSKKGNLLFIALLGLQKASAWEDFSPLQEAPGARRRPFVWQQHWPRPLLQPVVHRWRNAHETPR